MEKHKRLKEIRNLWPAGTKVRVTKGRMVERGTEGVISAHHAQGTKGGILLVDAGKEVKYRGEMKSQFWIDVDHVIRVTDETPPFVCKKVVPKTTVVSFDRLIAWDAESMPS